MATEAQILAALRTELVAGLIDDTIADKRHITRELAIVTLASGIISGGGGSGTTTPTDIATGIDASTDVETIRNLLADIKAELVNTTVVADIFIQDSSATPRYFVRQDRIDQTTGIITVSILNLDGTIPAAAPALPLLPVKAGSTNLINEDLYLAVVAGAGYAVGDSIANIRLLNGETSTLVASTWYNITTGTAIASAPPIANLKGYEDKLEELLTSLNAKIPALATDSQGVLKTSGNGYSSFATINRAANITAYAINDVYGAAFELANFGAVGGHVILSGIRMIFNISSLPAGMSGFLLFLYSSNPPSIVNDNDAFSIPAGDRATLLTPTGIEIGSAQSAVGGGSVVLAADNLNLQFKLITDSVWGRLVSRAAFTPAAPSESATITALTLGV